MVRRKSVSCPDSSILFYAQGNTTLLCSGGPIVASFSLAIIFLIGLYFYYTAENRRLDQQYGLPSYLAPLDDIAEDTFNQTDRQMSNFRYLK